MAVFTNTRRIQPSKEPSFLNLPRLRNTLINPSCNRSCASSALLAYLRQTAYILGENRWYNNSCIRRSPARHPLIKSFSVMLWLLRSFKLSFFRALNVGFPPDMGCLPGGVLQKQHQLVGRPAAVAVPAFFFQRHLA